MTIPVLILHAPGTNRDGDAACAIELAGGTPHIIPLAQLREEKTSWLDFGMLVLPGGFSYGDALGAGRLWALDLQTWFQDQLQAFSESGRPAIGICNGFQALVKAGLLPGREQPATLTFNASGQFECRWVHLTPHPANTSPWLEGLQSIYCPIAHGEGRFLMAEPERFPEQQLALVYASAEGLPAAGQYPANPNGSLADAAGITNAAGNILGLMPHPEDHIFPHQSPLRARQKSGALGLGLFVNGIKMAS
jgi:phosphoribosylformylglycinamidine synthase subunit PurQ / glutaminase